MANGMGFEPGMTEDTSGWPTADLSGVSKDPDLWSIILGMIGQATMGEHQQSWQAQLGRGAAALGQSGKAALAAEEMGKRTEERETRWMDLIRSLSRGGEVGGAETPYKGPEAASAWGLDLGVPGTPPTGRGPMAREPEAGGLDLFEGYAPRRREPSMLDLYLGGV